MFSDIYHIGYQTRDKDAAIAFYRELFGATLKAETTNPDGGKLAFLRIGNTEIELIQPADTSGLVDRPLLALDHIGYVVDSVDATLSQLEAKGARRLWPEPRLNAEGARLIYIDPTSVNGIRFHITERPR